MTTQKQLDANRRNALKSTGPMTDDGKKQSRRNALKHGLAGSGLVLPQDDADAVQQRMAEWNSSLKPFDPYEMWMLEVIAVESIRVDRCRIQDRVLRDEQMRRACDSWDEDQRQSADELASKLARDPSVLAKLRSTVPGATILLERWRGLSRVLENGDLTMAQEALAHDMLGTPATLRDSVASPLFSGSPGELVAHRREVVREQIERLERLISDVNPTRDSDERDLRKAGLPDLDDRALLRLHRYESRCFRRLMWATHQMQSQHRVVASRPSWDRESGEPRPLRNFTAPPPVKSAEPPIYRRPLLQHALDRSDLKFLEAKMKGAKSEATSQKSGCNNLPTTEQGPGHQTRRRNASD